MIDRRKISKFLREGYVNLAAATVSMAKHHRELTEAETESYAKMVVLVDELEKIWKAWPETTMH